MNESSPKPRRLSSRLTIIGLVAIFLGPILLAMFLNIAAPSWLPLGQVNRGTLFEPAVKLSFEPGPTRAELAAWKMALVADHDCAEPCARAAAEMKKVLPALGRRENRVSVVRLTAGPGALGNADLATLSVAEFSRLTDRVPSLPAVLLIDPRDFAVLHYPAPVDAGKMLKDLERLLRISKQEAN